MGGQHRHGHDVFLRERFVHFLVCLYAKYTFSVFERSPRLPQGTVALLVPGPERQSLKLMKVRIASISSQRISVAERFS